jgi:hypothetical protein
MWSTDASFCAPARNDMLQCHTSLSDISFRSVRLRKYLTLPPLSCAACQSSDMTLGLGMHASYQLILPAGANSVSSLC